MTIKVPRRQFEFDADGNIIKQPKTIEEQRDDLLHSIRSSEKELTRKDITKEHRVWHTKSLIEAREQLAELKSQTTHQHNP